MKKKSLKLKSQHFLDMILSTNLALQDFMWAIEFDLAFWEDIPSSSAKWNMLKLSRGDPIDEAESLGYIKPQ